MALSVAELCDLLDPARSQTLALSRVAPVGFVDPHAAVERLRRVATNAEQRRLLSGGLEALLVALSDTAQPDLALINFERFVHAVPDRTALYRDLRDHPRGVEILVRLFVGSPFLTEILLSNPAYLKRLTQHNRLAELKSVQQLYSEAQAAVDGIQDPEEQLNALRRFQRWELLRIGTCDFFGLLDFRRVTVQLSLLADALTQSCLTHAYADSADAKGFTVIAMGKLGGEELNYSSDIDLVFLADSNSPAHWRVGQRLIKSLTGISAAGFMYRVDMRLRPWGRSGELVSSVESHLAYLTENAQLWEKQALLKARVIAGDAALGISFLKRAQPHLYDVPADAVRDSVRGMKQKIEENLQKKGRGWGEVKLGQGSIRDVEFVVQYLQLIHGGKQPSVRSFNTLDALVRLAEGGFLHADEYRVLSDGYVFLRTIEHALQLMHNKQTHELPKDEQELSYLARRLDFGNSLHFLDHYRRHCEAVRAVFDRYLGARDKARVQPDEHEKPALKKHLSRLEHEYFEAFSEPDIERHAALAEQISESNPVIVEAVPAGELWRVTIVGYDYPGELSLICGLLLVHGFDTMEGQVFTYERLSAAPEAAKPDQRSGWRRQPYRRPPRRLEAPPLPAAPVLDDRRQKIVDVFTVRATRPDIAPDVWQAYADDLRGLLGQLSSGHAGEAQGALVKRVARSLRDQTGAAPGTLYPVEFEIDNGVSEQFTVLRIRTLDTVGFLYELTNALALSGVYIARVRVLSEGNEVFDTLHVTDAQGQKITDPHKQRELRAATVLIKHFTHLLPRSPNPEAALVHFREFIAQLFTRPDWTDEIASLEESAVLEALARLLGVSDFLWNDFLRMQYANLFPVVRDVDALAAPRPRDALSADLQQALDQTGDPATRRDALNDFKDREMFRVDMRHILGHIREFSRFSEELTDVAEVVVAAATQLCVGELTALYGQPLLKDGKPCLYSVCALGKCGGRELGFASDIELMFLYAGEGKTSGRQSIAATEFYVKLVEGVTHAIRARREGIFEIDLRLRPYGRAGSLAVSLDAFEAYFGLEGAAWPYERQALVKLRPIAGDAQLGDRIIRLRDALTYAGEPFDVPAMRGMRERQIRQLVQAGTFNAKLSRGGLVDTEYLVQGLQITHGDRLRALRSTNTLQAVAALAEAGILTPDDAGRLTEAYNFLRQLIGALRVVRGNAKDLTLPPNASDEFAYLARRLGYDDDLPRLRSDLNRHVNNVLELSEKLLG
ncbi:MAG: glutamine synthetase adenylyltransferase [Planctomycetaceae bacterium]|nr:glutamine synthetase adenylyltransferase [Planctomycetaceae bacterium]